MNNFSTIVCGYLFDEGEVRLDVSSDVVRRCQTSDEARSSPEEQQRQAEVGQDVVKQEVQQEVAQELAQEVAQEGAQEGAQGAQERAQVT